MPASTFRKTKFSLFLASLILTGLFFSSINQNAFAAFDRSGILLYGRPNENSGDFTARATDPDVGDYIYYTFFWDGATERVPGILPNPLATACGTPVNTPAGTCVPQGTAKTANHAWTNPGSYSIYATATDQSGAISSPSATYILYISQFQNIVWPNPPVFFIHNVDHSYTYVTSFTVSSAPMYKLDFIHQLSPSASYDSANPATAVCNSTTYSADYNAGTGEIRWASFPVSEGGVPDYISDANLAIGKTCVFTVNVNLDNLNCLDSITNNISFTARNAAGDNIAPTPDNFNRTLSSQMVCPDPWFRTVWGDIHSNTAISNHEPSASDYTASYMITTPSGSSSSLHSDFFDSTKLLNYHPLRFYTEDLDALESGAANGCGNIWRAIHIPNAPALPNTTSLWFGGNSNRNIFHCNGNVNFAMDPAGPRPAGYPDLPPAIFLEKGGTLIVGHDLTIKNNVYYDPNLATVDSRNKLPSVGFIVKGDLNIDANVHHIVGTYYVLGNINTDNTEDTDLIIEGSLIAPNNSVNLQRRYIDGSNTPAELVRYDGRALVNTPPGFTDPAARLPLWPIIRPH